MFELCSIDQLSAALQDLTPVGIKSSANRAEELEHAFDFPQEGLHLAAAVVARRNEFIGGRRCARAALELLGYGPVAIPTDADGLPVWPDGCTASISHSRGLCCAVAASSLEFVSLGIDLEKTTRLSPAAMKRVVHPAEMAFAVDNQAKGSLLFSAKEAFFKMQFPAWRAQPNFKDLALAVDESTGNLSVLEIADHLPASLREAARHMRFRYRFFGDYVVTLCWVASL
jgi:4'-phosphopantetheinyl transferase EntD